MRKFGLLFIVVAVLLAVVPTFAQDEEAPTIADVVVSSTEAEEPQFTVLLAAVQAADPVFIETLADEEASVTVFAPTDDAFAALLEALELSAEDLLANTELLNEVLSYHVVPGAFDAESVIALDGALLGTILPNTPLSISLEDESVFVNESQVITPDVTASNGIVHVIDSVLVPPAEEEMMEEDEMAEEEMMEEMGTIADIVIASTEADEPQFTTLLAAVQAADPAVLDILTGGLPYTVFAPTDAAFAAALEALGLTAEELLGDTETLTEILAYHVVPGYFDAETVIGAAGEEGAMVATTLAGTTVSIMVEEGSVMVNDATVAMPDVIADNGIIHVIDAVILPPEDEM